MHAVFSCRVFSSFSFNDTPPTAIYTLSLHDALPISFQDAGLRPLQVLLEAGHALAGLVQLLRLPAHELDERSEEHTLNSSHVSISYAVFCLKKKNNWIKIDDKFGSTPTDWYSTAASP